MEIIKVDSGENFQLDPNWVELATDWDNGGPMSDLDREQIEDAIASGARVVRVDYWHDESCQNERVWYYA